MTVLSTFFQIQAETDIIHNIKMWKQRIFLEYRIDLPFLYGGSLEISMPLNSTSPPLGSSNPAMILKVVVFPQPLGPRSVREFVFVDIQVDSPEHLLVIKIFVRFFNSISLLLISLIPLPRFSHDQIHGQHKEDHSQHHSTKVH